ncbi:MAG: SDR family oxidoreductase [Burkholderiales bacterium]|nr:SDR family oxidoreductase [Burkholderiales bacterium]MDE1925698.1 SDR family oxidoreductase [Burkholderiales bacterium]MDE2157616.1 SDR family oxidoreductase [Burkholderiales bacterium]MDE2504177.1 SDR family oxidoreductase [Burkholderiales bacterium]
MSQILLTGATGTIGSALLPRLLADPQATVWALIRARDEADLQARLGELLRYAGIGGADAARVRPLRGDITQPDFGLDAATWGRLAATTTHLIHCAASVKLTMTLDEAQASAVQPVRTVLRLARAGAATGALRKIDLVSTVGVWGREPGVMPERRLPEVRIFHNTYEAAKAEAERVVWAEGEGLPITVHRPSMVVGERGSGRVVHFQVFYHLCEFLSGTRTFGVMPELGHTRLDTVPVDWVAQAISWSSSEPRTAGRIFHLCSGPEQALALPALQARVRALWGAHGRRLPRLRRVDRRLLERLVPLIGSVVGEKSRRALRALPPVLAYLAEDQGFANQESALTFAAAGMPVPPIDSYLDAVLGYYLDAPGRTR